IRDFHVTGVQTCALPIYSHLHGRGSVDMKGGLAAATTALLRASDRGAAGHLLLTSDEEIGSLGAQHTRDVITDLALTGIVIPEEIGRASCRERVDDPGGG